MAIVKMKRLHLIAPQNVRRRLLRDLTRIGCVEVERSDDRLSSPEWAGLLKKTDETSQTSHMLSEVSSAIDSLKKYAGVKKSFLDPRRQINEAEFYDADSINHAVEVAEEINGYSKKVATLSSEEGRLEGQKAALLPWVSLDIPVDFESKGSFSVIWGACPASSDVPALISEMEKEVAEAELTLVGSDKEQNYLLLVCHRDVEEKALDVVKTVGFSRITFKGLSGTVSDNISSIDSQIADIAAKREEEIEKIAALAPSREALELAFDSLTLESQRDDILASLGATKKTVYLEGWVPAESENAVASIASELECAWEFTEPEEGEEPPVFLKNNRLVEPFSAITDLYGMPNYNSIVDPNPFVAVSFFVFFGLMFSDAAYGLILALAGLIVLKRARPTGGFRKFMLLAFACGISTFLWGAAFGGWFGDIVPKVSELITGTAFNMPALMDPITDPMSMLILSLGLGVVHLFVGMGISAYRMIKRHQYLDAFAEVFVWYMLVGGLIAALVGPMIGIPVLGTIGLYIAIVGAVCIFITAGRSQKNFFKKITSGLSALYGSTSYLSDILSYSRLMALCLATGVVASVINTLGSMFGANVLGFIVLFIIFIGGQVFNFAISILGAFVHSCRLEYVEFFGKFFEGTGRQFKPLFYKTKYVEIIKEDK